MGPTYIHCDFYMQLRESHFYHWNVSVKHKRCPSWNLKFFVRVRKFLASSTSRKYNSDSHLLCYEKKTKQRQVICRGSSAIRYHEQFWASQNFLHAFACSYMKGISIVQMVYWQIQSHLFVSRSIVSGWYHWKSNLWRDVLIMLAQTTVFKVFWVVLQKVPRPVCIPLWEIMVIQ